jgi:hypothetical protein
VKAPARFVCCDYHCAFAIPSSRIGLDFLKNSGMLENLERRLDLDPFEEWLDDDDSFRPIFSARRFVESEIFIDRW